MFTVPSIDFKMSPNPPTSKNSIQSSGGGGILTRSGRSNGINNIITSSVLANTTTSTTNSPLTSICQTRASMTLTRAAAKSRLPVATTTTSSSTTAGSSVVAAKCREGANAENSININLSSSKKSSSLQQAAVKCGVLAANKGVVDTQPGRRIVLDIIKQESKNVVVAVGGGKLHNVDQRERKMSLGGGDGVVQQAKLIKKKRQSLGVQKKSHEDNDHDEVTE